MAVKRKLQTASPASPARALIAAAAKGKPQTPPPTAEALEALREVCEYNDTAPWKSKVTVAATIEMLNGFGWQGKSEGSLHKACRNHLGRKSFVQA